MSEINATKRSEMLKVDPRIIVCQEGMNTRIDFDLPELKESIRKNGVIVPVTAYKLIGIERYIVIDGERRIRAVNELLQDNPELEKLSRIPLIVVPKPTDIELNIGLIVRNDGKPFAPMELAATYKKLFDLGLTVTIIAEKIGKSYSHVNNTLNLLSISEPLKKAVKEGKVTASTAKRINDQVKEESVPEVIAMASVNQKGKPGKTVIMKDLPKEVLKPIKPKKEDVKTEEIIPSEIPIFKRRIVVVEDNEIVVTNCQSCLLTNEDENGNPICMIAKFTLQKVNIGEVHGKCPLKKYDFFISLKQ